MTVSVVASIWITAATLAEEIHSIKIDGNFSDWASVPSHFDPVGGPGVLHNGIPDTHDTDHDLPNDTPAYVNHPDIDLVEYKFTHDVSNLYAYFRATGVIGHTSTNAGSSGLQGRYYVIVTIDVDNSTNTGYGLHEGGYFPTSYGYDVNMEVEYFNGHYNKGNYLNHGCTNDAQETAAFQDQRNGIVRVLPGSYGFYPEWVWFDTPNTGTNQLPPPDDYASIRFVSDRGPSYQGITRIALSPDGHQAEMVAPFRGFMREATQPHTSAKRIIALGKTLNISFSLEASPQLAPPPSNSWASDTGDPIVGYYLSPPTLEIARSGLTSVVLSWNAGAVGMLLQATASLTNPNWQVVAGSATTNQLTLTVGANNQFYRLAEP